MLRCGARTTSAWEAARVRHHRSMRSAPRTGAYASVRIIVRCANAPTPHTSRILRTYRTTHVPAHVHTPCMQHTCPTAAACANLGRGDDDRKHHNVCTKKQWSPYFLTCQTPLRFRGRRDGARRPRGDNLEANTIILARATAALVAQPPQAAAASPSQLTKLATK
jgi:hypothetical protein